MLNNILASQKNAEAKEKNHQKMVSESKFDFFDSDAEQINLCSINALKYRKM